LLPEGIETWIGQVAGDNDAQAAIISRRASARFARMDTWRRDTDGELHDWVVEQARKHVTEYGATELALDCNGRDRVTWRAEIATVHEEIILKSMDPKDLLEASWRTTFRSAQMMLDATSAAPRLMHEIGTVYTEAIAAMRDATQQSEGTSIAAVAAEAAQKKLDRIMGLIEHFGGGGTGNGIGNGERDATGASTPERAAVASRTLLGSISPDDLPAVLGHPLGQALAIANTWDDLKSSVGKLVSAFDAGEIKLSVDSVSAVRAVIRTLNG
jgi:hypothetical protein